jgi:flagellar hook capping protein FlgD
VQATGVTIDLGTFYPVRDGYRDYVHAKGSRLEPASVRVLVYNPSNRVVRTFSLARASGGYSITWNGRSTSGALQPAGRYKVVQQLTDAAGMKLTVSKFVVVSLKKLVFSTKYITKNGSSVTAAGHVGSGSVGVSTTTGIARLRVTSGGWAGAGYQFSLPSATVYRSLAFQAYVKGSGGVPPNELGMQNFKTCSISSGWHESCFDHWGYGGAHPFYPIWRSTSGSPTNNRSGRDVRGLFSVNYGTVYVYKVRVKVVFGVLK